MVRSDSSSLPGPGQYRPEISQEFLDHKRSEISPKSAVFMRKPENRSVFELSNTGPGVGAYDPIYEDDIGLKAEKKKKELKTVSSSLTR